jgi:hypothetical protein
MFEIKCNWKNERKFKESEFMAKTMRDFIFLENSNFMPDKTMPLLFKFKMLEINHDMFFSIKERYSNFRVFKIHSECLVY